MVKKLCFLTLTLCALFLMLGLLPVHGEDAVYDSVLRLHVLANSDSEEDQELKLAVRDALLTVGEGMFDACRSREEAQCIVEERLSLFEETARAVVSERGYDYDVTLHLGYEEYPRRQYEAAAFPAGEYLSLRVVIGEGTGENWWCVLFPPMCMSAASGTRTAEEAYISVGLTGEQYRVITESESTTYAVRFKILEALEAWCR